MLSPRNQIEVPGLHWKEIESVDILFDLCNVEFKSRVDVYNSFREAKGTKSWARYYLLHEVRKVAARESIYCSYHMAFVTATKLSQVWFEQKETL